jgi:hypothetical protein
MEKLLDYIEERIRWAEEQRSLFRNNEEIEAQSEGRIDELRGIKVLVEKAIEAEFTECRNCHEKVKMISEGSFCPSCCC